jgi:hypothetical protein
MMLAAVCFMRCPPAWGQSSTPQDQIKQHEQKLAEARAAKSQKDEADRRAAPSGGVAEAVGTGKSSQRYQEGEVSEVSTFTSGRFGHWRIHLPKCAI